MPKIIAGLPSKKTFFGKEYLTIILNTSQIKGDICQVIWETYQSNTISWEVYAIGPSLLQIRFLVDPDVTHIYYLRARILTSKCRYQTNVMTLTYQEIGPIPCPGGPSELYVATPQTQFPTSPISLTSGQLLYTTLGTSIWNYKAFNDPDYTQYPIESDVFNPGSGGANFNVGIPYTVYAQNAQLGNSSCINVIFPSE